MPLLQQKPVLPVTRRDRDKTLASPMRSMTGFGSGDVKGSDLRVKVELRSVNHRYLKSSYHLPDCFAPLQGKVDALLREKIGRGAVHLSVFVEELGAVGSPLDGDAIASRYQQLCRLRDDIAPDQEVRFMEVVSLHEASSSRASVSEETDQQLLEAVEAAIADLRRMQENEGERLRDEFARILKETESALDEIESSLPEVMEWLRDRYSDRIQQLVESAGGDIDSKDLLREVGVLTERSDITEELSRLRGHLTEYRKVVADGGRVGRRLDFLTQEMFREANTMTSKLPRHDLAHTVVGIKVNVDRLREQTQNIE